MKRFSRRNLLAASALGAAASARGASRGAEQQNSRKDLAFRVRMDAAHVQTEQPQELAVANGDELAVPRYAAAFTKGFPHDQNGEVDPAAYRTLLHAVSTGNHADYEAVSRGSGRRFVSPQAAHAFQLEGGDSHRFACPPPPSFSSTAGAAEMNELYWQAVCRDVPFLEYAASPLVDQAVKSLQATPGNVFRGPTAGDRNGPYLSQFLAKPIPSGSTMIEQRYRTPSPGADFVDTYPEWLQMQTGVPPWREPKWDPALRYIRSGRDLAEWVHYDFLYQAFLNAALIIMDHRPENVLSDRRWVLQPNNPYRRSNVQDGFVTFGFAEVVDWMGRVTTAALKAAWYQKWQVHRRLRPEEFGGRIHQTKTKVVSYPIHADVLNSSVMDMIYGRTGNYLLPQAFPEGAPLHPAYPSGHATVAGACSAVLKALFDESALIPDCVHASADGLSLLPCPASFAPTIGAELDKLAFNVAMGRNWAGIHYRSDAEDGIKLGEDVAISVLQDLVQTFTEDFAGFEFTRAVGTRVRITPDGMARE